MGNFAVAKIDKYFTTQGGRVFAINSYVYVSTTNPPLTI